MQLLIENYLLTPKPIFDKHETHLLIEKPIPATPRFIMCHLPTQIQFRFSTLSI